MGFSRLPTDSVVIRLSEMATRTLAARSAHSGVITNWDLDVVSRVPNVDWCDFGWLPLMSILWVLGAERWATAEVRVMEWKMIFAFRNVQDLTLCRDIWLHVFKVSGMQFSVKHGPTRTVLVQTFGYTLTFVEYRN